MARDRLEEVEPRILSVIGTARIHGFLMAISVVVPTYNRRETVRRTLQTLFAQTIASTDYEIIVVVDGSTDGTAEALQSLRPACHFRVHERPNGGLAAARNTGFRLAESEFVLFLDDDMLCDPHMVALHHEAHQLQKGIAAFGAIFLSPDSPPSLAAECFNREIGAFHLQHLSNPGRAIMPEECVFGNASVPRAALVELGGFDEQFRMREDLELGTRLFGAGYCPVYVPGAITHEYYDKNSSDLIRDAERFAESDFLYDRKHPGLDHPGHVQIERAETGWKKTARSLLARAPILADAALAPLCFLGESFFGAPTLRNLGVRALIARRRIHWLHRVNELERNNSRR